MDDKRLIQVDPDVLREAEEKVYRAALGKLQSAERKAKESARAAGVLRIPLTLTQKMQRNWRLRRLAKQVVREKIAQSQGGVTK